MIKDLALVSTLFEYPEHALPAIYNNATKYFNTEDIHVARFLDVPRIYNSLYEKLYAYKIKHMLSYIQENIANKYQYMMFVDGTDTNFYRDPIDIVDEFLKFNKSIVFCGEVELWPGTIYTHLYDNKIRSGPFKFLNSGGYIGHTAKIVEHLVDILEKDYEGKVEDQSTWTIQYLLHDDIEIDSEGKIFFSTHKNKHLVSLENGVVKLLGINPYVVHDNGPHLDETIKLAHLL